MHGIECDCGCATYLDMAPFPFERVSFHESPFSLVDWVRSRDVCTVFGRNGL